ncbi:MAG: D-2-hydroxyacid dehydrogenase [Bryobacteraceae bacterium]
MQNHTVLVLSNPTDKQLAMLERLPERTSIAVGDTAEAFERTARDADVILNWGGKLSVFQQVFRMAPQVRWIHSRAAGLDGVMFPELAASPVTFTNGRGVFSQSLGEFVIGAVLFYAKDFRRLVRNQEQGRWESFDIDEISSQTMGIVGYGDIGRACARRAHALGMQVLAVRRRREQSRDDPYASEVHGLDRLDQVLPRCDYVVAAAPNTPESRGVIGAPQFALMKESAVIINVGRGPVIDEAALIGALQKRRIRGAALDVFETEPLAAGHAFYGLDNVLLSPHCADHTRTWLEDAMQFFLDNFERYHRGEPLLNVVDKSLGY